MYLPASFEETRIDTLQALARAHPLATLITRDAAGGGALVADHLPMQLVPSRPEVR